VSQVALFDSHAHLEHGRFDVDRSDVIARAVGAGVSGILTCGSDLVSSGQSVMLAQQYAGIYAAVGVHGHEASSAVALDESGTRMVDEAVARLKELAALEDVVAIGEIGLDYHYDFSPREVQRPVFAQQLALALELDLPVVIHNREADVDTRRLIQEAGPGLRGVMHCFMADAEMAQWALGRGLYLGVAGPITFKSVKHLPEIMANAPADRLLVETDCPYLAPHPRRGKRNEPAYVMHVAQRLADIRGVSLESLSEQTTANACVLLRLDRDHLSKASR